MCGDQRDRVGEGKGTEYLVTEDDRTLGGGHAMQYTDHVSQ